MSLGIQNNYYSEKIIEEIRGLDQTMNQNFLHVLKIVFTRQVVRKAVKVRKVNKNNLWKSFLRSGRRKNVFRKRC